LWRWTDIPLKVVYFTRVLVRMSDTFSKITQHLIGERGPSARIGREHRERESGEIRACLQSLISVSSRPPAAWPSPLLLSSACRRPVPCLCPCLSLRHSAAEREKEKVRAVALRPAVDGASPLLLRRLVQEETTKVFRVRLFVRLHGFPKWTVVRLTPREPSATLNSIPSRP
jgi:hypothetical protein